VSIRHISRQEYFFPNVDLFYSQISKNSSTTVHGTLVALERLLARRGQDTKVGSTEVSEMDTLDIRSVFKQKIHLRYKAQRNAERATRAKIRLVLLRNPHQRLASAWLNKFFMMDSILRIYEPAAVVEKQLTQAQVVDAYSSFVASLAEHQDLLQTDAHLALQQSRTRELSFYNLVLGAHDASNLLNELEKRGAIETQLTSSTVPRLNQTKSNLPLVLNSPSNVKIITELYAPDYALVQEAAKTHPSVALELTPKYEEQVSAGYILEPKLQQALFRKRSKYFDELAKKKSFGFDPNRGELVYEPVALYVLCYNEAVLLPHMVHHYRRLIPNIAITVLDNESTDGSVDIARSLGCSVVSFKSGDQLNDHLQSQLKNTVWADQERGWMIVVDMDEWLCVSEYDLRKESRKGTTILRTKGWNIVGRSSREDLSDIDVQGLSDGYYPRGGGRSKLVAFRRPMIRAMHYGIGAHTSIPTGDIVYSENIYVLKHMDRLGATWLKKKYSERFARATSMQKEGIARHYTNDLLEIEEKQRRAERKATLRNQWVIVPQGNRGLRARVVQRAKSAIAAMRRAVAGK
jgi:hypothetical protein